MGDIGELDNKVDLQGNKQPNAEYQMEIFIAYLSKPQITKNSCVANIFLDD